MKELIPGTTDAVAEKHIPVIDIQNNLVTVIVGEVEHPMTNEHYIEWISLQTKQGNQRKALKPGDKPQICFSVCDGDEVEPAYAYCNLHSLWKAEVEEELVCDLKPVDPNTKENYIVCKCNKVSYFDILDELQKQTNIDNLLDIFEAVKNTTHCSTGCGGCYDKVIAIISDTMMSH